MPSQLDQRMTAIMAGLTAAEGMLPVGTVPSRWGVDLPYITAAPPSLPAYMAHYATEHADKTFLVAGDERLTFAQVHGIAQRVARGLVAHGVKKGDRVGIAMRNSPAWIVTYMGVLMAGGVASLLNGWWQADELAAAVHDVECSLIVADPPRVRRLAAIDHLPPVIELDDLRPIEVAMAPLLVERLESQSAALPELGPDDWATILFTSGSTGLSKGAISTHRAVLQGVFNYLAQAIMMMTMGAQDGVPAAAQPSTLLNVPLFHVTAEVPVFLQSFAMGRKLVLMPKWDAEEAMRLIQQEGISYFVGVPLMSYEILNHPHRDRYDLSTVTDFAAGGAPRPPEHVKRIKDEMGGPDGKSGAPLIGYGLTETNGVGTGNWRENYLAKPNSAGLPSKPLVDLAILDDAGRPVRQGERGEICIRSVANFSEYWGKPEATAACFTADGYFRTGDLGYLDEDGYVFIVDRKKDIIIRGGENISCQEVEAALYEHPAVAEAAVFGLPDERFGEVPGAVVHLTEADAIGEDGLCDFLKAHIAAFKVPARIWFSAAPLPRLGTEKIDKVGLRNQYRTVWAGEVVQTPSP